MADAAVNPSVSSRAYKPASDYGNGHKFKLVGLAVLPDGVEGDFASNAQELFHEQRKGGGTG